MSPVVCVVETGLLTMHTITVFMSATEISVAPVCSWWSLFATPGTVTVALSAVRRKLEFAACVY